MITGEVVVVEELGSEAFVHIHAEREDDEHHLLVVRAPGETTIKRGDRVSVTINGPVHVFNAEGERLGD